MIQEIIQVQDIDILHMEPLILDYLKLHNDQMKILFLDFVILIEISIPIVLHHIKDTLNFLNNEETPDLFIILLSEAIAIIFFVYPTLGTDSSLEFIGFHIGLHQDHVPNMRLHLQDLSILYNQTPLKITTVTLKIFQTQAAKLKLTCIPLKRQVL